MPANFLLSRIGPVPPCSSQYAPRGVVPNRGELNVRFPFTFGLLKRENGWVKMLPGRLDVFFALSWNDAKEGIIPANKVEYVVSDSS